MEARNALPGICGTVSDLFKPDDGYQQAISVALGGAVYHIITVDDSAARNAIRYLKNNHSGRATFLPMNIMQPRYVNKDHLFIAEHTNGFLGLASDFVDCEEKYDGVLLSLLGNTMICDTLDNASRLSARLKQGYNIVTLDGDTIHRGGSISGGYNRKQETPMTLNSLIDDITRQIADTQLSIESLQADFNKVKRLKDEDEDNVINLKIQLATLQQVLAVKRSKYESLQEEYDRIKIDENEEGESFVDELIEKLNNRYKLRDETSNDISTKRSRRINLSADEQRKEIQLRQKRQEDTLIGMKYNNAKIEKTRLETLRDNQIERLSYDL